MRAVILAAGRGSRLGNMTEQQPKCLTGIAGRRLLDWQIAALADAGIRDVTVVRGYRSDCLHDPAYATLDNPRWSETNMVATLQCASALLEEAPCLILYADIVYHPDHVQALAAAAGEIVVAYDTQWLDLWRQRFADPLSDAETFRQRDGYLQTIGQRTRHLDEIEGQYMGMIKSTPSGWRWTTELLDACDNATINRLDMTSLLQRLLSAGRRIACLPVAGRWCEVDTLADLQQYETLIANADQGVPWSHDWRWNKT
jgi:L-glutamine-phosphate cytidylyltransferase